MKQPALSDEDALMNKYYIYYERKICAGSVSPLNGIERITLGIFVKWLCERYHISAKHRKN